MSLSTGTLLGSYEVLSLQRRQNFSFALKSVDAVRIARKLGLVGSL